MPSLRRASLLHAVHYMRLLYEQNQSYLRGGEEQSSSLKGFEVELPNLRFIQGQFHDFIGSMKELMIAIWCSDKSPFDCEISNKLNET